MWQGRVNSLDTRALFYPFSLVFSAAWHHSFSLWSYSTPIGLSRTWCIRESPRAMQWRLQRRGSRRGLCPCCKPLCPGCAPYETSRFHFILLCSTRFSRFTVPYFHTNRGQMALMAPESRILGANFQKFQGMTPLDHLCGRGLTHPAPIPSTSFCCARDSSTPVLRPRISCPP